MLKTIRSQEEHSDWTESSLRTQEMREQSPAMSRTRSRQTARATTIDLKAIIPDGSFWMKTDCPSIRAELLKVPRGMTATRSPSLPSVRTIPQRCTLTTITRLWRSMVLQNLVLTRRIRPWTTRCSSSRKSRCTWGLWISLCFFTKTTWAISKISWSRSFSWA